LITRHGKPAVSMVTPPLFGTIEEYRDLIGQLL
jgi:hypothetical protein